MAELKNGFNSKFTPVFLVIIAILLAIIAVNSSIFTYNFLNSDSSIEKTKDPPPELEWEPD